MDYKYRLFPMNEPDLYDRVLRYWEDILDDADQQRIYSIAHPTMEDIGRMLSNRGTYCFAVLDVDSLRVAGDVCLTEVTRVSANVHFGIHPSYRGRQAVYAISSAAHQLFNTPITQTGKPLLSFIGHTPVTNTLAIKFAHLVGFKDIGVLTKSLFISKSSITVDGLITQIRQEDVNMKFVPERKQ